MNGILKKFELKEFTIKATKKSFRKLMFEVDVKMEDSDEVKTLKGDMTEEYARKYFAFCGVKTKDLIGKEVGIVTAKKMFTSNKDGKEEKVIFTFIKYLNVLDQNGDPLVMASEKKEAAALDF